MSHVEAKLLADSHAASKEAGVAERESLSTPDKSHLTPIDRADATRAMIVARASRDPAFKAKLLADAPAALKDVGLGLRKGMTLKVVEDSDTVIHLVLPAPPSVPRTYSRLRELLNPAR